MTDKTNLKQKDVRTIRALLEEMPEILDYYQQCAVEPGEAKRIGKVKRLTKQLLKVFGINWFHRVSPHLRPKSR